MNAVLRREKHRQELRQTILDAARELFASEGYESFSMRKLAKRVQYSPGSIYLHFKNKEQLFECLVDLSFARLLKALQKMSNGNARDPVDLLRKGLRAYVEFGLKNPNDYRFAFVLRAPDKPYKVHDAFKVVRHLVTRCVEERRFRAVDPEVASQALWAAAHGITSLLVQRPNFPWKSKNQIIDEVCGNAIAGFLLPATNETSNERVINANPSHV